MATETNKERTKVSVITITFNDREGLAKTIESVASQTYNNIEYIIIDGGSKDGTVELIKENEKIISSWCSEPDKGIYNAMNKGVDKMTGDWCLFMNSGDTFYDENSVEKFVETKITPNTALVYGDTCLLFLNIGEISRHLGKLEGEAQTGICHQSSFIRCDLMKKYKYDESFKIVADVNLFHLLIRDGYEFVYLPQLTSKFVAYEGISSKPSFKLMHEYHRVWGVPKYSLRYIKDFCKCLLKIISSRILPKRLTNYLAYLHLKKVYNNN
jgi:glycosyltransferase involved in cell wall biosynthesis